MSSVPPATPLAPQDDSAAQDWSWPPAAGAEEERRTIVRPDPGRAVVDVCLPHQQHDLEWPPSAADLASIMAVSLDDEGVRQLASSLVARPVRPPRQKRRGRLLTAALAASCVAAGGSAAWWAASERSIDTELHPVAASPVTSGNADRAVLRTDARSARPVQSPSTVPDVTSPVDHRDSGVQPPQTVPAAYTAVRPDAITPLVAVLDDRQVELATAPVDVALPSVPVDRIDVATSVPADALAGVVPTALTEVPSRRASAPGISDAPPVPDTPRPNEEPAIRALLERYGTAYSRLDAGAARAVWPAVDVQALTRAFDALESQDIDFERCDVEVDGSAARAACRGTSTWVPRVGERRPHRDAREWTFRLARDRDAQWRIQSASMR